MITSRNLDRLDIVQGNKEPQTKKSRGRPRKDTTTMLPSQKNCQEEAHRVFHVQKLDILHQESGCIISHVEKDLPLQQERLIDDNFPGTDRNSNPFCVPKLIESRQQKTDVSLLHNTQPNPLKDDSGHVSSAMRTLAWKDKPSSEFQGMSEDVTCLTPPGSNECLSTISGDECPQTPEEPSIQKACQSPSNVTISLSSSAPDPLSEAVASSPSSNLHMPQFHQGSTITDSSKEMLDRTRSPCVLPVMRKESMCGRDQSEKSITEGNPGNSENVSIVATDGSTEESDGLAQVRIAKTFSLSKDELSSSCTHFGDMETQHSGANSTTSVNNVPVKVTDDSSILPRRERKNIFQALGSVLNSQTSNQGRNLDASDFSYFIQQDEWHQELSVSDPEIPCLEAYGGSGQYGYASHNSPHSGGSDTLPILEKEAFHGTCLDDDDEFEFENPSDVTSEFDKPRENVNVEDFSHNWPLGSDPPQPETDIIDAAEAVDQDLQKEDAGVADDEEEFEFETPDEDDTIHPHVKLLEEQSPSHIAISESSTSKEECIHNDRKVLSTPTEIQEKQTDQCDDMQFQNSFPNLGISPNHLVSSASSPSMSASGNSSPSRGVGFQDCKKSPSTKLQNLPMPDSIDTTEELNGNATAIQEFHVSQKPLHQTWSEHVKQADIIENDQEKNGITLDSGNISEQNDESSVPDSKVMQDVDNKIDQKESSVVDDTEMQEMDQQETHSKSVTEEVDMAPGMEGRDEQSSDGNNPAECNDESSEKPNTSQDMNDEHLQSNTAVDKGIPIHEAHPTDKNNADSLRQESQHVADPKELPNSTFDRCSPELVDEEKVAHSVVGDIEISDDCKADTNVQEGDSSLNGQDTAELSSGATDLLNHVRPSNDADSEACKRKEKRTIRLSETPEDNLDKRASEDSIHRASQEENHKGEEHPPIMQCKETEFQEEEPEKDLHKKEVISEECPATVETSCKDTEKESKSSSDDNEEDLVDVGVLQDSYAKVEHASLTASEQLQATLESKEDTDEVTTVPSKPEDCSDAMELQEQIKEPQSTLSTGPDVEELCPIRIDKRGGQTDVTKSNEQQEPAQSDSTKRENDNPLSSDSQNESDFEDSQPLSLSQMQQNQVVDALQQSNSSIEQEIQNCEKEESNPQPSLTKDRDMVKDQSADHQLSLQSNLEELETSKLDQSQKELTAEYLGQDCPKESVTTEPTVLPESLCSPTHPNGSFESSANQTDTSQDGNNLKDDITYSNFSQTSEGLVNLIDAKKQANEDPFVYLGGSTCEGTMDMLSVACEETVGGYDEDAMSTTSSGGATIPYPLSDGDDWNDHDECNDNNVAQVGVPSSTVQDVPNLHTTRHRKDVEHSLTSTACKWTVKFTNPKKRKRSRDRHLAKGKRKSHKKQNPTEKGDKKHIKMTFVADSDVVFGSKSPDTATKLSENEESVPGENSQSLLQEEAIVMEPSGRRNHLEVDDPMVEKEINQDLEKPKSPQKTQLVSHTTCKLPISKSSHSHLSHINESSPAEANQSVVMKPIGTNAETLGDSNSEKRPSSDDCQVGEPLNGGPEPVVIATSRVEDLVMIAGDDPRTLSAGKELYSASATAALKSLVPSGSLPSNQGVTPMVEIQSTISSSGCMTDPQREGKKMQHTVQSSAEEVDIGAKTVQHIPQYIPQYIPQDKATFFGTPRNNKTQIRPQLNTNRTYFLNPSQQSSHFLQQQPPVPMIQLRNPYLKQSGTCDELKQHLLSKEKLVAPDLPNLMHHQPQSQLPNPNQRSTSRQNSATYPSERELALNQLAELRMQSQIDREKRNANVPKRENTAVTINHTYLEYFRPSPQRNLPIGTNPNHFGAQGMSVGLGHEEYERPQFHGSRVATAGTFSPPIADQLPRNLAKFQNQQIHDKGETSRVRYSPAHHHLGYADNIPVYTTSGPKEQLIAVYPDGTQAGIPPRTNLQQNLQPARKSSTPMQVSTVKQPQSNPGKEPTQAPVDQDIALDMLRQLHGGCGAIKNDHAGQDLLGSQTSCVSLLETPHVLPIMGLNQSPTLIQHPSQTSNQLIHQLPNPAFDRFLSSQRMNMVDSQHVLYHPHTVQSNQGSSLTGAATNLCHTTSRTPTPRMHSRTPTPKSNTTSTTYTSDNLTILSHQPVSTELERASLSRTSTPRSHCTPSSTPNSIGESTLPGQMDIQTSQMLQKNSAPEEEMPLDLTCKARTKVHVEQNPIAPLDLSCKPRMWDAESREQIVARFHREVIEESRIQVTLSRSQSEHPGSDIVEANRNEARSIQSEMSHSSNTYTTVDSRHDRSPVQTDYVSHQDRNISRQDLNTELLGSKLGHPWKSGESTTPVEFVPENEQMVDVITVPEQYVAIDRNVCIERVGQPHAFSDLLDHGLTSEGPGLKIAKTCNTYVNPATGTSSIPLIDLTTIPKKSLTLTAGESAKTTVAVHHRLEQVPDETNAKKLADSQDQFLHVSYHLRRTRSDDTEVRHSSSISRYTSNDSPAVGFESNKNQPDGACIDPQNMLRSSSTSNIAVAASDLQVEDNLKQLKSNFPKDSQPVSDMSQCPKKRYKRAHEAYLMQSVGLTPSKMPAVRTASDVTQPAASLLPSGRRKRGRPRGSKKTFEASLQEAPVNKQCKFCEFGTTSRQEMKNHVNEVHFEKYRAKAASEKADSITNNPESHARFGDEFQASVTAEMGLGTSGSKVTPNISSKVDMPERLGSKELSQEISNTLQTGADYCHHCDIYFNDTSSLAAHQRIHHKCEKQSFECRLCEFSDSLPGPLVVHINKMHLKELRGGPCPFRNCSRKFLTLTEVKEHLNDHWIVKQYACKICGVRYQVFSSLKAHLDRHKQDLPNTCKVCTLSFKTPGTLKRHQKLKGHLPKP
ncbi:uncharacterized protein LOC105443635 isoform X2 [Strongylocentrotus purpuratus]|uniref:C2H2-type domain-containing protein n=1 Tax=Strongylocentrotus purpuratus TaxID=7668 RepID=A0A7M7N697_STRPU|nr:uncharacterized protein LOC105443635 isoform X2 [Strongylocentrotus purpuratus]XP_030831887.1 uncharacterized protein LOC105443635 isoform X2 [Strongylocentrotus purpuratus]XP_030831888.1 uncharacterized protein LOC105443635 isoform X2 [Strongylocentrotus purpuratus]XP_030831889.1 uncharacterized protein LOC105443635 isoform X2 [Strongylocentrotus purpuratus]XP_030831890.1 uncharacterized protein LOC105443635 isoform X2 [Strongylocentrotus purpuratus]XP_030831891.1 uncharacterized protein L